jgi:Transglycosylase-like domain
MRAVPPGPEPERTRGVAVSRSTQGSKGNEGNEPSTTGAVAGPDDGGRPDADAGDVGCHPGVEGSHTKRVTPARPDRFRQLLPQALVVACLAGGTCASLAADHDHAAATDAGHTLNAVTAAHQQPAPLSGRPLQPEQGERLPQRLVLLGGYQTPDPTRFPTVTASPSDTPAPAESASAPEQAEPSVTPTTSASPTASATAGTGSPSAAATPAAADTAATTAAPARPKRHHKRKHKRRHHHRATRLATPYNRAVVPDLPEQPAAAPRSAGARALNWHGLAHCEASNRPDAVDPSGTYGGLYQFDVRTWHSVGGHGLPQDAPAAEQTRRAMRLYTQRGAEPWPVCGPRLYR